MAKEPELTICAKLRRVSLNHGAARWTTEETRLLLAMRSEGVQRAAIGRILCKSPRSVKKRLERVR